MYQSWSVIAGETPLAAKWNILGTNDAFFDTEITQLKANNTIDSATDGATVTFNMATRRLWHVQIGGNRTFVFSNVVTKRPFAIFVQQDGTGSRVPVWPSGIDWVGGSQQQSTTANKTDAFLIVPKPTWVASSNEVYWGLFAGFGM